MIKMKYSITRVYNGWKTNPGFLADAYYVSTPDNPRYAGPWPTYEQAIRVKRGYEQQAAEELARRRRCRESTK